jgi:hypothetical protein
VLLPGVSILARQVAAARTAAEDRLHATVARATYRADPALPPALVGLLAVPDSERRSELERLRRPPTRSTGTAMARALDRVNSAYKLARVQILAAVRTLPGLARRTASKRSLKPHEVDTALVPRTWRPAACLTLATNAVFDLDHRVLRAGGGADAPPGPAHRR